jgi:DNA-binding protein YbaB
VLATEVTVNSSQDTKIADITRKAETAKARLQQLSATCVSKDGAVTVTVNVSGALQGLSFAPRAHELPLPQLAASVLATAQRAQAQAAQQLTTVMAPLIGTDSEAMKFLEEQLPAPEVPDEEPPPGERRFAFDETRPASPPPRPAMPPRPSRPRGEDEGDDFGSILRKGW